MIAAIDIGSNSVRLLLQYSNGQTKLSKVTRLAEGLDESGLLKLEAINRTLKEVKRFMGMAIKENAENIYIFATEAVRRAENIEDFLLAARLKTGLDVDVVGEESEALIGFLGAADLYASATIIDIGGASTEVAVSRGGQDFKFKSIPVGSVVLTERFGQDCNQILDFLSGIVNYDFTPAEGRVYLLGGTGATLSAMDLEEDYNPLTAHGRFLKRERVEALIKRIYSLPVNKRNLAGLSKNRREVVGSGACILLAVMDALGLSGVTFSECDNLEGYIKYKTYLEDKTR